jgi:hypothetical protein
MPMIRSAKRLARSTLWMFTTTGIDRLRASDASNSMISTEVFGSSEEVGSSASTRSGFCITARAMPTRWRWPPESASARRVANSPSPTASSSSKARSMSACGNLRSQARQTAT